MEFSHEIITSLREAVIATPDNLPLRRHLAELLLAHGDPVEAADAFRQALRLAPMERGIQLGLAESYLRAGKVSAARVLLEEMLKDKSSPPKGHQLMARLLAAEGRLAEARAHYKQALEQNASLQDTDLDRQLFMQVSAQLQHKLPSLQKDTPSNMPFGPDRVSEQGFEPGSELGPEPMPEQMSDPIPEPIAERLTGLGPYTPQFPGEGVEAEKPLISFADVGGMEAVKEEIGIKIIQPLKHPDLYRAYGKAMGGGLLLYGPPGCGKTHLARATAGEVNATFISVGINEILEMWLGQSERNLHAIFEQARLNKPCVLFFDEVDALGASRSDMRQSAGRQLINQFLLELDGVRYSNEGILTLAATNAPWHLDTAFRRPGRFDRMLFVPPPDQPSREAILAILLAKKPCDAGLDLGALAKKTDGFSGADLSAVVDNAVEDKLREAFKSGQPAPITQKDLLKALKRVRPSTKEWFTTARNYALYANQSGFYDEILQYLNLK